MPIPGMYSQTVSVTVCVCVRVCERECVCMLHICVCSVYAYLLYCTCSQLWLCLGALCVIDEHHAEVLSSGQWMGQDGKPRTKVAILDKP